MAKSILELMIGNIDEKRDYRKFMKRVNALPKDYRFAFRKIQHYMYNFGIEGCNMTMLTDLVNLFEVSAAEGKAVLDIIGSDVATFCDELFNASIINSGTTRENLNQDILKYFYGEGK